MKLQASHNAREWMTTFIDGCHEMALGHLQPYLQKMFENCNIALLDFADKAQSGTSQIQFMEAGRSIQKNREQVETIFYRELEQGFTNFKQTSLQGALSGSGHTSDGPGNEEQLTLLSREETDLQVAKQNMATAANIGSTHELTAIRQRLAVLNNGRKLAENQVPAGPYALADAFQKATDALVLEHEIKLIVFLLFDKFVLSNTSQLYDEYNEKLLKAGLLPNLKYKARKNPNTPLPRRNSSSQTSPDDQPPETDSHSAGGQKSLGDELFDSIFELMSRRNPGVSHRTRNPVPQAALVSAIHNVQQSAGNIDTTTRTTATPVTADREQVIAGMVAGLSAEREELFRGIDRRRLPAVDTQMIELVGMMFEYLLNDDDIPNAAKAELSRLHTPYLKVAILDKTLFSNNAHPAHDLLNELARASTRWVFEDNLERGIFPCMRKIIMRIILDFRDDTSIFTELLDVLHSSLHDLDNKAVVIEEHSRMAAEGKEKLELARARADSEIRDAVGKHHTPGAIRQMLGDVWRDKLMFIYLREAEADQSDSWGLAAQTIESILWCVEPRTTKEDRTVLQENHLAVIKQIRQSIDTLSAYGSSNASSELALIREHTKNALEAELLAPEPAHTAEEPAQIATEQEPVFDQQAEDPPVDPIDSKPTTPEKSAAEEELDAVPFGTWFSIRRDAEHPPVQAKLSWYSEMSGNYMFVDSMGIKLAVMNRQELLEQLVSGNAEIMTVEQRPLIRRAMETIRRMLGNEQPVQA